MRGKLTAAKCRALSEAGRYGDGNTLFLVVAPRGSKSWVQRLTVRGRRRDIGLGGYPLVTLAEAREQAEDNRRIARKGGDPLEARRKAETPTFREAAKRTFEANRPRWRNDKHAASWMQTLERYAMPALGHLTVDAIDREAVLGVLTPIWGEKPETARRVRQRVRTVLQWAVAHGFMDTNSAGEPIDGALPRMPRGKAHYRALPHAVVGAAVSTIESSGASIAAKGALAFLILTAARSGEVRGATWSEVDVRRGTWTVPASRMKAGVEHRVPLSAAAREVLERVRKLSGGEGLVFPSPLRRGQPLSDMALTKVLRDCGLADRATVHGFRSSFRDWAADCGEPRELAEAALAHVVGGVEGSYFRSDLFDRRRALMDAWGRFVRPSPADVVAARR